MNERTTIGAGTGGPKRGSGAIAEAIYTWNHTTDHSPARREQLMKLWCDAEVLRLTNMRAAQKARAGNPGPEGSIAKLAFSTLNKAVYEWCIDTRQPSPVSPMRSESGTRASVRYTSLNSASPVIWRNGRTSTPGACMSTTK